MNSYSPPLKEIQTVLSHNQTADRLEPLRAHLAGLPQDQFNVQLTFEEIVGLIGEPLPKEAHPRLPSAWDWWCNAVSTAGFGVSAIFGTPEQSGWVFFGRGLQRWPGVVVISTEFGHLPVAERLRQLAFGYLESAKKLCIDLGEHPSELTWPRASVVLFCYRHSIELFLKACILQCEPLGKCNHNIGELRKQYDRLYPQPEYDFHTLYDISLKDVEDLLGGQVEVEDFERKEDQVYRYFSDKDGRSPKGCYAFGLGTWLSQIEALEYNLVRISKLLGQSAS